jgi:hypothetical protein
VGGFYENYVARTNIGTTTPGPIAAQILGVPSYFFLTFKNTLKQYAGFGEGSYQLGDFRVTAGMRYYSPHEINAMARLVNAMQLNGVAARLLDRAEIARMLPLCDLSATARHRCIGGYLHESGATARHDAVAWGYARRPPVFASSSTSRFITSTTASASQPMSFELPVAAARFP